MKGHRTLIQFLYLSYKSLIYTDILLQKAKLAVVGAFVPFRDLPFLCPRHFQWGAYSITAVRRYIRPVHPSHT